ncbi:MAG: SGNH/GDSL hydrolase family protein [Planctomycetia bacterium]|nr:SGNH/GDSL hydrolase family protein [Planctomycetia bacterium]
MHRFATKFLMTLLTLALCAGYVGGQETAVEENTTGSVCYKDFQPQTAGKIREDIEWSITYSYGTLDNSLPRLLLIGDSICNAYQNTVRDMLSGQINVSFWASSECLTHPEYFRTLDLILDANHYDYISFNNGLHSLGTDQEEWSIAYDAAVRFIKAKCPDSKLFITNATPLKDPGLTEKSRQLNAIAQEVAAKYELPVIDLFGLMDPLDREEFWSDPFHYKQPGVQLQATRIVEAITAPQK